MAGRIDDGKAGRATASTATASTATEETSFAETALTLGGKSADEARRTGAIDRADDQVETLFAAKYQTAGSPVHRAIWERGVPTELFSFPPRPAGDAVQRVMDASVAIVDRHRAARTLLDEHGKIAEGVLAELGAAGYWGLLVDREYGGSGTRFAAFAPFLTRMAMSDPTVAGLASVHGCIGAVDPVRAFGSAEQKQRFLPRLASGQSLSAFALTEPAAGSDLTALRTRAVRDGDSYIVTGEKLFITNVAPGRTIGLVCLIDEAPSVLIVELPSEQTAEFKLKEYGLYALRRAHNRGIVFNGLRVPAENLLKPTRGDGLTIAYHGLNLGRVALCANAAGTMRQMLASMIPWGKFRRTYGASIATRELVQRRLGRMAGLIVGCDALVAWCAALIDEGYRGEMECIVAKIFGSEAQKEAAIELLMKTHGGRSFLHGHLFGDNVHEFLAPCIYEGEGEMLGMAFFESLVKQHGKEYFEPIGKAAASAGLKKPNPLNPLHAWKLRKAMAPYAGWLIKEKLRRIGSPTLPPMPARLREHAEFACNKLQRAGLETSEVMSKFQLKLADRQCRMSELSSRIQSMVVMLCAALYGARHEDELVRDAADVLCEEFARAYRGDRPSNDYFRRATKLGEAIADGGFRSITGLVPDEILMRYE